MVKAILFDFWGTLVENGVWSPIKQVRNILNIRMPFSDYVTRMEKAMMTKKFESLKQAFVNICEEFNVEVKDYKIESLIGIWNKSWMLAKPYEETIEILEKFDEKYKLVLIVNSDNFSVPKVLEKFDLAKYFDKIFFSFDVGLIKTDKKYLELVLNELNLEKEDCLLVGDSIQSDIKAADNVGIRSILIDRKNTKEYQEKIQNLKELENKING